MYSSFNCVDTETTRLDFASLLLKNALFDAFVWYKAWFKMAYLFWRSHEHIFHYVVITCIYILYNSNGISGHLNNVELSSPKDALCKVWSKLAQWFWRRRFLNFVNVFSLFRNYLPLEKGGALHLNKLESPSPTDALCQVWLKLAQWFLRRSRK